MAALLKTGDHRAFFGESMFHRERDASKVALVHLVARLRAGDGANPAVYAGLYSAEQQRAARAERPVPVFNLDGRPHLASVRVPATDVSAYGALLAREGAR